MCRLILAPVVAWCIYKELHVATLAIVVFAILTDFGDGFVARRFDAATAAGGLLDHTADCTFVTCAALGYSLLGVLPPFLVPLIVLSFAQYLLDSGVMQKKKLIPSRLGRYNGIAYFVVITTPAIQNGLDFVWIQPLTLMVVGWILCITTIVSMGERFLLYLRRDAK